LKDAGTKVIILTARQPESVPEIKKFLDCHGVNSKMVSVFGSNGSRNKLDYLSRLIKRFSIKESVLVFEDNLLNISDLISLEYDMPDLTFNFVQVIDSKNTEEDLEEARKFEYPKGEYGTEKYQRILKRIHPAMKRRLIGLGGNDYLDKGSKKVKDFKRSKSAPPRG
jgi:hydroxymethylpyrimidine pyrophosphatase-like HAD family hydrolase